MRQILSRVRPRPRLCQDCAPRPAPECRRRQRAADYSSHNAPRGGQGWAEQLEPGLRHERPAKAVFLGRRPGEGRWEGEVARTVAMSASAGGRGPANLRPQSRSRRAPVLSRGSGRVQ